MTVTQHADIEAITLDLDDTLWAIGPVIARAERRLYDWFKQYHPKIPEHFARNDILQVRADVVAEHADRAYDLTFIRHKIIERMALIAGCTLDVDEAFGIFDQARNEVTLFPEVLPVLSALAQRYRLIAVTNGNANLEKIGISEYFSDYISARRVGAAKPAAVVFEAAVEAGGAAPGQTLHIGDDPRMDVEGARRAGLKTAWVNRVEAEWPQDVSRADLDIRDMHALARWLDRGV